MKFVDRVVQHPNRIRLIPTGNANEYDVERAEGSVTVEGTPLIADNINTFAEDDKAKALEQEPGDIVAAPAEETKQKKRK